MRGDELLEAMREQAIEYGTDYRRAQVFLVDVEDFCLLDLVRTRRFCMSYWR